MPLYKSVPTLSKISINSINYLLSNTLDQNFSQNVNNKKLDLLQITNLESDEKQQLLNEENLNVQNGKKNDERTEKLNNGKENQLEKKKNDFVVSSDLLMKVEHVVIDLIRCLTSHSQSVLHDVLFWSILSPLNELYSKGCCKESKILIREISSHFINSALRILDFGSLKMLTESTMFQVLFNYLKHATNLEKLVFDRSCFWRANCMKDLGQKLSVMPNLEVLHIHYICEPQMLKGVPKSCPLLKELSLKGSKAINDEEVPILIQFKELHTLDISGTKITGTGCRGIVLNLLKLMWLTHCPFNCNSDMLIFESRAELIEYIKKHMNFDRTPNGMTDSDDSQQKSSVGENTSNDNENDIKLKDNLENKLVNEEMLDANKSKSSEPSFPINGLKLRNFWLFNPTTEELLLTSLCPSLSHLRIELVLQDLTEELDISLLSVRPTSVSISAFDGCPTPMVTTLLEGPVGSLLTTLHLRLSAEWFCVAPVANIIAQSCPLLETLTMEGDFKGHFSIEESDERLDMTLPPGGLPLLREARLIGCVTDGRLSHLLSQAPNLTTLYLDEELEHLHDATFISAIQNRLLLNLQVLWFNVSTSVTLSTVRRLIESENELRCIGRACLMKSSSRDAYNGLLHLITAKNLNLEIVWVRDQRLLKAHPK